MICIVQNSRKRLPLPRFVRCLAVCNHQRTKLAQILAVVVGQRGLDLSICLSRLNENVLSQPFRGNPKRVPRSATILR